MRKGFASLLVMLLGGSAVGAAIQAPAPIFRSGVDLVTVAVTVRTKRGRPVPNLARHDFQVIDAGEARPITQFRSDDGAPVNLALLVDFSGSMGVGARRQATREAAVQVLGVVTSGVDRIGLYGFDTQLRELHPLTPAPGRILTELDAGARPFGATSLFDAIAETGRLLARASGGRRAVVAFTDGADNASRLTPAEVSGIASGIDVPVYIVVVVSPYDRSGQSTVDDKRLVDGVLTGPLADLARWTGGEIHVGVGPEESSQAANQIVAELRQQYLIAFEPGRRVGWHPIEVRTRDRDLVVRARSGYIVQGHREG